LHEQALSFAELLARLQALGQRTMHTQWEAGGLLRVEDPGIPWQIVTDRLLLMIDVSLDVAKA
jgi:hypothetical protein